jgi:hypothetical protein
MFFPDFVKICPLVHKDVSLLALIRILKTYTKEKVLVQFIGHSEEL